MQTELVLFLETVVQSTLYHAYFDPYFDKPNIMATS